MSERMDLIAWKKVGEKSYPMRVGSAVPKKKGDGWQLYLDAIPAPENGQYQLTMQKPRERDDKGGGDY